MPITCADCGMETSQYTTKLVSSTGQFRSTCKVCEHPISASPCLDPYRELVLDHVHDESGKPLRVTSARQLREAEKRYKFRSVVAHSDEANFDKPPQQQTGTVFDFMTRENKWTHPETAQAMLKEIRDKRIDINTW